MKLIIAALILLPTLFRLVGRLKPGGVAAIAETVSVQEEDEARTSSTTVSRLALAFIAVGIFGYAAYEAAGFRPNARLLPMLAIVPGLVLSVLILVREIWALVRDHGGLIFDARAEYPVAAVLLVYGFGIALFGMNLATAAFLLFVLLYFARMRLLGAILYSAVLIAGINGMFLLMRLRPPGGYIATVSFI